jgi:hypothetical protein
LQGTSSESRKRDKYSPYSETVLVEIIDVGSVSVAPHLRHASRNRRARSGPEISTNQTGTGLYRVLHRDGIIPNHIALNPRTLQHLLRLWPREELIGKILVIRYRRCTKILKVLREVSGKFCWIKRHSREWYS